MQATKSITKRQKEVLNFVIQFMAKNGYSPSLQEIARFLGTKNISTAQYFIQELEEKGYLKKKSHIARGVSPLSQTTTVPLLGLIAAGDPIEPIENPEEISVPESISIDSRYPHYALQIKGDSMMDMGILNGDIVLIKHQLTAQNGDVVVGITEKGATLKVLCREGSKIFLEPRNKDYPIIQPKHLEIRGKFVGLLRKG
ncbi:MAG: LexA repressor [uncultured bacterium]|uniref:LexA repressor n=1 Tax=Candidatus Curtissbacteria bacterium GW2011_GWC2_38_9 TaxID=1618414 RepID=A0A0G0LPK6_9BACT|nr:MAG: LexA repressor [uncultured bacterium]KKQ89905.1 MAG: LexA repressor [Candidatus Curtissbacteria bacterium GW2011_GWC2_38_9]OGE22436.1 MAG: repressor LexA [Candidatus Daviesbacteria bacterium RIFCSPHIGHO2_01_FULL_40_24]OGE43204.1 MAG: repressor LexA [Candidatus Daviesbacteria bacterium RIFCSPLOWO2_01_FULL_39_23]OGE66082.1 MAG: repressor LexA [Candidatus Daviesbacteria bacterium RIFCSPLOWO2_02_FULL_39_13]